MVNPSQTQTKFDTQKQDNNPQNQSGQKDQYANKNSDTQGSSRVGNNTEKDEPRAQDRNQSGMSNQKQDKDSDSSCSSDKKSQIAPNKSSSS